MKKIQLAGNWKIIHEKHENGKKNIELEVEIPTTVFEALINNGIIEDPFYGGNEHLVNWVYESEWSYQTTFNVPEEILNNRNILIKFNGLDTITDIYLNDQKIGETNNMFRAYEFDVKSLLKKEENVLKILFHNQIEYMNKKIDFHKYWRWRKILFYNAHDFAIPGMEYLRKPMYSWGWDWGPKLPDIGVWKPIEIIAFNSVRIDSIQVLQEFQYNMEPLKASYTKVFDELEVEKVDFQVNVELNFSENIKGNYEISLVLKSPNEKEMKKRKKVTDKQISINFSIYKPHLWWIHELGTPNLYELEINLKKNEEIIDSKTEKIGIRDLNLVRTPDKWGESFYFMLNGVPIFAKGANWVPIDNFIPRGKKIGLYSQTLKAAKEANINFIRVWGGGIYELDEFYDLCDEIGLLVWQDFPFACDIYPFFDKNFLLNIKEEIIQNIKRLRNRASLAIWCGNNECEWLLGVYLLFLHFRINRRKKWKLANTNFFERILPGIIKEYDPERVYWPSSPSCGGRLSKKGAGLRKSNNPNKGDSHYWGVWHSGRPFSAYRKFDSRFMSEYGFESFPVMKTIETFCPPDQFDFYSPIMKNHQKNPDGNKKIMNYMKKRFSVPKNFKKQVILSQITQAEAIEYGVEHWRRKRNNFQCMGSLYWQLNDCWPVASWSSLDYNGQWKALHYFARRFYAPFFPSVIESKKQVTIYLTNDLNFERTGKLHWIIQDANGNEFFKDEKTITVPPCSSVEVKIINLKKINKSRVKLRKNLIFYYLEDENGEIIQRGFRLFAPPKFFPIKDPRLDYYINKIDDKNYELTIKAKEIALFVFIESDRFEFNASDNFFSMNKNEKCIINLIPLDEKVRKEFAFSIKVRSLYDLMEK